MTQLPPAQTPPPDLPTAVGDIAATLAEFTATLTAVITAPTARTAAVERYLSGRWNRRDGTVYAPVGGVPSSAGRAAPAPPARAPDEPPPP